MDHLVDPDSPLQKELLVVPWLGFDHDRTQEYPVYPFRQYPLARGWTPEELRALLLREPLSRDPFETLAMLQSWLLFGFLEDGFCARVPSSAFVVETADRGHIKTPGLRNMIAGMLKNVNASSDEKGKGRPVVKTTKLQNLVASVLESVNAKSDEGKKDFLKRMRTARASFFSVVTTIGNLYGGTDTEIPSIFDEGVLASILRVAILVSEMHYMVECLFPLEWRKGSSDDLIVPYAPINKARVLERLKKKGWCPSVYGRLRKHGMSTIEFAALTDALVKPTEKHDICSPERCIANNVDEATYKTVHFLPACKCRSIKPHLRTATEILQNGNFFLISLRCMLTLNAADKANVIVQYTPFTPFVAFSHVWSHGLGSSTEHGLPTCQIAYLHHFAIKATGGNMDSNPLIWIDSLCIPLSPSARRSAIRQMATIYSLASTTVVLEHALLGYDLKDRQAQEVAVRLLASSWMQRLWTLQEGALAKNLQFAVDGAYLIGVEYFFNAIRRAPPCPILLQLRGTLTSLTRPPDGGKRGVEAVLGLTCSRACSKAEDETLAVAPLMGLDVSVFLSTPPDERMGVFWRLLGRVPGGILFLGGEKLGVQGLRWAPKSFSASELVLKGADARITPSGLKGDYYVFSFEERVEVRQFKTCYVLHDCAEHSSGEDGGLCDRRAHMSLFAEGQTSAFECDAVVFKEKPVPGTPGLVGIALSREAGEEPGMDGEEEVFRYGGRVLVSDHRNVVFAVKDTVSLVKGTGRTREVCIS